MLCCVPGLLAPVFERSSGTTGQRSKSSAIAFRCLRAVAPMTRFAVALPAVSIHLLKVRVQDERIHDGPVDATRLCIENPFNRAIDVGRSAFNFEAIRQQMAMTFKKLMSTWEVTGLGDLTPRVPVAPSSTLRMSPRPTA